MQTPHITKLNLIIECFKMLKDVFPIIETEEQAESFYYELIDLIEFIHNLFGTDF